MSEPSASAATSAARPSGTNGRVVAVGLVLFLLAGVTFALGMWWWGRDPRGPIQTIGGIDADHCVVVRLGFEERSYTHVGVWRADDVMVWSEALFGVQDDPGLVAAGDLVLVLVTEARGNPALHAFDRRTGEFRWKVEQREPLSADPLRPGDGVVTFVDADGSGRVIDLSDGSVRETLPAVPRPHGRPSCVLQAARRTTCHGRADRLEDRGPCPSVPIRAKPCQSMRVSVSLCKSA